MDSQHHLTRGGWTRDDSIWSKYGAPSQMDLRLHLTPVMGRPAFPQPGTFFGSKPDLVPFLVPSSPNQTGLPPAWYLCWSPSSPFLVPNQIWVAFES
ncbi:hypothetical protein Q3G72_034494 [Acer saccharum]|nr:hypothetical protein Q3G72_034494 [Acer saccharum]